MLGGLVGAGLAVGDTLVGNGVGAAGMDVGALVGLTVGVAVRVGVGASTIVMFVDASPKTPLSLVARTRMRCDPGVVEFQI